MNDSAIFKTIIALSVVVFGGIIVIYQLPKADEIPLWAQQLPKINAMINGTCTFLLLGSLMAIKNKKVSLHRALNITTFVLSAIFLVSYVISHSYGVETKYPPDAPFRIFYLFILLTHILLAAVVLPLVLLTFYFGLKGKLDAHRRIARFSYPIWIYVTVSGVIVYSMISPYYRF